MKPPPFLPAAFLYLFIVNVVAEQPAEKTASWFWQKGFEAAHKNAPDTALVLLKKSYEKGISDDSLYYLWSEIFMCKNVLDTALALNLSIQPTRSTIRRKALEQRYSIYTKLGWTNEAQDVRDSISGRPAAVFRNLMPEWNAALSAGVYRETSTLDRHYPYPRPADSTGTISDGSGDASLRLGWQIPVGKTQVVQFGARLRYSGSRFSTVTLDKQLNDSTDISAGAYFRYKLFSDRLALGYTCNRRKDFLDRESFLHQFTLQYAVTMENWLASVSAGYHVRNPYPRRNYYVMVLLDRPAGRRDNLSLTLYFSGMTIDEYAYRASQPFLYFHDGMLFYDSSLTDALKNKYTDLRKTDAYTTLTNTFSLPQSYQSVNPSLNYDHQISKKVTAGIGGGYQVLWYLKKHSWTDYRYPAEGLPTTGIQTNGNESYLVLQTGNRRYYWVDSIKTIGSEIGNVTLDTLPLTFHSERRVDQTLSLNLYFNYSLRKLGTLQVDASIARNFSTLEHEAPIDIQQWYAEIMMTWFFQFKP